MTTSAVMRCASCTSVDSRPSRPRSAFEYALVQLFPLQFRRCHSCMYRAIGLDVTGAHLRDSAMRLAIITGIAATLVYFFTA